MIDLVTLSRPLLDEPLAQPPTMATLEQRVSRLRRRRLLGGVVVAVGSAALVVIGGVALDHRPPSRRVVAGPPISSTRPEPTTAPATATSIGERVRRRITEVVLIGPSTLRVSYAGAMCEQPAGYSLQETATSVTITMFDGPSMSPDCLGGISLRTETVTLRSPLGQREVIDGDCLESNQATGHGLCRVSLSVG